MQDTKLEFQVFDDSVPIVPVNDQQEDAIP